MKKILFRNWAIAAVCLLPVSLRAANAWYWTGEGGTTDWCNATNWIGRAVPNGSDTAIFREHDAANTNISLNCDTAVARVKISNNAISARIVRIGPNETADHTLTINGAAEAIGNESVLFGNDLTLSGEPNGNGAKLKLRINSSDPWSVVTTTSAIIVNCDVSGSGGINKTGVGTLIVGGNNSFVGDNFITAGRVILGHPNALGVGGVNLGTGNPVTVVSNLATLDLAGQANINEVITLNGVGLGSNGGALINSSNSLASIIGGVLSSISLVSGGANYTYPTTATISGGGGSGATATVSLGLTAASITLTNGGVGYTSPPKVYFFGGGGSGAQADAILTGDTVTAIVVTSPGSGYTGALLVVLNGGNGVEAEAVANATNFTVVSTSVTAAGSGYTSPPTVSFSAGSGSGAAATANLTSLTLATDTTIAGSGPISIESSVAGSGALIKKGVSILTLSGANTYSGGTIISAGTLLVNNTSGSGTGSGNVIVTNGGTLGGSGSIAGPATVLGGGSVGAGSSAGVLTFGGGLNLSGGGTNVWELAAFKDDNNGTAGTDFDQIALTGGVLNLSGSSKLLLKFTGAASAPYSLETFWQTNHSWTILTVSPPGSNATNLPFANLVNGIYNAGSFSNYVGSGGKIMLTYTANPLSKPVITSQPQGVSTNWGRTATFSVTALGSDPVGYQWYFQNIGGGLAGATNSVYIKTNVQPEQAGDYFVIITNTLGGATSDVAVLNVVITPPANLQTLTFVGTGTTNILVNWSTVVGGTYQLLYNTNLNTTNWFVISNLVANGASATVAHRRLVKDPQRFYRVIGK